LTILYSFIIFFSYLQDFLSNILYLIIFFSVLSENIFSYYLTIKFILRKRIILLKILENLKAILKIFFFFLFIMFRILNLVSYSFITFASTLSVIIICVLIFRSDFRMQFRINKSILITYLKYSFPFMISATTRIIYDNLLLIYVNMYGNLADVANFSTAFQIYLLVSQIPMMIGQILLVTFSKNTQNDIKKTNKIILIGHKYMGLIFSYFCVLSLALSDILIKTLLGNQYHPASSVLNIILFERIFVAFFYLYYLDLQSKGHTKFSEITPALKLPLLITFNIIFIKPLFPLLGIEIIAYMIVLISILYSIFFVAIIHIKFKYDVYFGILKQIFVVVIIFFIIQYFNFSIQSFFFNIIIKGIFVTVLFFLLMFILKIINKSDIKFVVNTIKKIERNK